MNTLPNGSVWVAFPSADAERARLAARKWSVQRYKVAIYYDVGLSVPPSGDFNMLGIYPGYWAACNRLAAACVQEGARVIAFAADDIDPDPNFTAAEIGGQFLEWFPDGFGVMQPCGDPQGADENGCPAAHRIAGSPWVGLGWIKRAWGGRGPFDERYFHFFGDEVTARVAEKLGVMWWRPDLTQFHRHWSWGHQPRTEYQDRNSCEHWDKDKALFERERDAGFPGHEPAPREVSP